MNQVERQFIFNLQLFAEGDAPAAEPAPAEPATQEPSPQPTAQPPAAPQEDSFDLKAFGSASTDDQIALLKKHGFLGTNNPEPKQTEAPTTEPSLKDEPVGGQPAEEPQTTEPKPEPEVEIKVNGEVKKVKQSDLVKYAQMGFDYTQKTQELAAQRRQLELMMQQQQFNQQQQEPTKQVQSEYETIISKVEKDLGLDPGQFNPYEPAHQFAFNQATVEFNNQKIAKQQLVGKFQSLMQEASADPQSQEINTRFDEHIYKLASEGQAGFQKAMAIQQAKARVSQGNFTEQDLGILVQHWNYTKQAINMAQQAKAVPKPVPQTKPTPVPPKTEAPGNSIQPPKVRMDYRKLGHMKQSDQIKALKEAGFFKRT